MKTDYCTLLEALRGLRWPARRRVRGATHGAHASSMIGTSPEFTEYRPYRQGEDPRRLDWKLLARTDRAYLRITSDRALLATIVVLDASASMAYPPRSHAKWAQACRLAVGLLAVAQAAGDPIGLLLPSADGLRAVPPRTRRGTLGEIARLLGAVEPGGTAPLAPVFARVRADWRVVVVGDFLGDEPALRAAVAEHLRAGGETHAVHVVAAEELRPGAEAALAVDPERPELRRSLSAAARAAYTQAFGAWRAELARGWRIAGAGYTEVLADEPADRAVRRIVAAPAQEGAR